jgi:hypothetical protein
VSRSARIILGVAAVAVSLFAGGCFQTSGSDMTKQEIDAIQHPPLHPDAAAMAGMAKQGEMQKKQLEANAAAGVDSRGVPLAQSHEKDVPPGPKNGPGAPPKG